MIWVYGTDPFGASPSSKTLLKELLNAGFKPTEIKHAKIADDIPEDCYVLSFGAPAFKELTGFDEPLSKHHGTLWSMESRESVLVFPQYSPGYLFHNPKEIGTFKSELELARAFIKLDAEGVIV